MNESLKNKVKYIKGDKGRLLLTWLELHLLLSTKSWAFKFLLKNKKWMSSYFSLRQIQQSTWEKTFRISLLQLSFSLILDMVSQDAHNRLGDEVFSWFLEPSRIPSENTLSGPFIKVSSPSYFDKYCFISWVRGRRQLICLLSQSRGRRSDNFPYWWYMWLLC